MFLIVKSIRLIFCENSFFIFKGILIWRRLYNPAFNKLQSKASNRGALHGLTFWPAPSVLFLQYVKHNVKELEK